MIYVSLSSIYDNLAGHDNLDSRAVRDRYSEKLEEQPMYSKSPYKYVTGDKPLKSYGR